MKKVTDNFIIDKYDSRILDLYFDAPRIACFDLETTGLSPKSSEIMLSGILMIKDNVATATQFFSEDPGDEKDLIDETLSMLENCDIMLTYNGRSFDDRFIKKRAEKYGICCSLPYDLDLYLLLANYSDIRDFTGGFRQKDIEKYAGIATSRDDEIGGYESIKLYERYLESPSYALEKTILLHNHDDISQLYRLLPLLRHADIHRAMFGMGFNAGDFRITGIKISGGILSVNAVKQNDPRDYISFPTAERPFSLRISSATGETEVDIPCEKVTDSSYVIDAEKILDGISELKKYPAIESGYLIVKDGNSTNYLETNLFIKQFFKTVCSGIISA